jgi:hypothetical protein
MRLSAIVLVALAGLAYCAAAWARWRALARSPGEPVAGGGPGAPTHDTPWFWLGLGAHSLALILALCQPSDRDFAYVVLAAWAAVAALAFARGFMSGPSRNLLALPVGAMALLIAMVAAASNASEPAPPGPVTGAVTILHIGFMIAYLAAAVVAGTAGGMYLVVARQLKTASQRVFALPALPTLERINERALIVATALLLGGLATGGAAIASAPRFSITHPTAILGLVTMAVLIAIFALRLAGRLNGSRLATAAVGSMVLGFLGFISLEIVAHG